MIESPNLPNSFKNLASLLLGRPRSVWNVNVTRTPSELSRFDSLVWDPSAEELSHVPDQLREYVSSLNDGGHFVLKVNDARAFSARLAKFSELQCLWSHDNTFLVGRKTPVRKPLSVTVGMISMNEEGAVGKVLEEIRAALPDAHLLLVDSSKDKTPEIAEAHGARVVRQFPPRGYGPAMTRLLYSADTDIIITMDCDGTYPVSYLAELRQRMEAGADLVNASRTSHRPKAMPLANFIANRVFATVSNLAHGLSTTDVHSGMRAYRNSMLRAIDPLEAGPALPVELLLVPARRGYRIEELDIPYFERIGHSTLQRFDSTVWTFRRIGRAFSQGGQRVGSHPWAG